MHPTLYLMIGYPGAGKTTIAQHISALTGAVHIWTDKERQDMFGGQEHTPEASSQLYTQLNHQAGRLLAEGNSVVFDTNFRFRKDRDQLRRIAEDAHANVVIIWVTTDRETAHTRATKLSENAPNRFFGNISDADFARVTDHLDKPTPDEHALKIEGSNVTEDTVRKLLESA